MVDTGAADAGRAPGTTEPTDPLGDLLAQRVDGGDLEVRPGLLVLAAYEGDAALADAVADAGWDRPHRPAAADARDATPDGAYLQRLVVTGFRGIGPSATLELSPGPGLTVVVGRNGSGKSSFAEGLEVALTGDSRRWADRPAAWKDGWRNLHHDGETRVEVHLQEDARSRNTGVVRTWGDGGLDTSSATFRRHGEKQRPLDELGWTRVLETWRPFLSHNELGSMLSGPPSGLHDAVEDILGLERLTAAEKRLTVLRGELGKQSKAAVARLKELRAALEGVDDDRARTVLAATAGRTRDLDTVQAALDDATSDAATGLRALRALVGLAAPSLDAVDAVAQELRDAGGDVDAAAGGDAARARTTAALLRQALEAAAASDATCPVCGTGGVLDEAWRQRTTAEVTRLEAQASTVEAAHERLRRARTGASELRSPVPSLLREPVAEVDPSAARAAWEAFTAVALDGPAGDVADALEERAVPLDSAVAALRDEAAAEVARRQDAWAPVAQQVASWLADARDVAGRADLAADVDAACAWVQQTAGEVRNERLRPLGEASRRVWETLRQESNVELGPLQLEGRGNRRRLALDVAVDGSEAGALGVMSQGELHALALALFLPRATLPESPFRFLVVDDPVQAMDPSKVDGLARVLAEVAETRQVVVFTHDDRLPESLRRLRLPARVLQVLRRERSQVEVTTLTDPVERALKDAETVARSDLAADLRLAVVPGLCRDAVEAACHEAVRRARLGRGDAHVTVEEAILAAGTVHEAVALALFDDVGRGGDVYPRLQRERRAAADALRAVKEGAHGGWSGDPHALVQETRQLCELVRPRAAR